MVESGKKTRLVGAFIRQRREALSLSQRALGLLFTPPVTTQFISNVERGVTPFPPAHVAHLATVLQVSESELMTLLEREYTLKLSDRLGKTSGPGSSFQPSSSPTDDVLPTVAVAPNDLAFMKSLYEAYRQVDVKTRQTFMTVCETILNLKKPGGS